VSQQSVERTLGKLLTDPAFRERFFAEPGLTSWEAGLQLTAGRAARSIRASSDSRRQSMPARSRSRCPASSTSAALSIS
jgi:hypothetical protein